MIKKQLFYLNFSNAVAELNYISGRDLSILFELVPENHKLIDFNTNTDGFTNNSAYSQQIEENQSKLDNTIGFNNYDVGHVFDKNCNSGVCGIAWVGGIWYC